MAGKQASKQNMLAGVWGIVVASISASIDKAAEMSDLFGEQETPQSKGGKARADALPPERRSEIAKAAAAARWQDDADSLPQVICGSSDNPMRIPALGIEIPC